MAKIVQMSDSDGNVYPVSNASGTGYCKMPDGTLIQWGDKWYTDAGSFTANGSLYILPVALTFPIEFVNDSIFVSGSSKVGQAPEFAFGVAAKTRTNATIRCFNTSAQTVSSSLQLRVYWMAIGRWK